MKKLILLCLLTLLSSTLAYGIVDCKNIIPCKLSRTGTPCESGDCPSVIVFVTQPQSVTVNYQYFLSSACGGDPIPGTEEVSLSEAGGFIYTVGPIPASDCTRDSVYSFDWQIQRCLDICAEYKCQDTTTPVNCDTSGFGHLPVIFADSQ